MTFLGILLLPFTFIYSTITRIRNHLYNIRYTKSFKYDTNVIGVGNLRVGGTGKTPMVEYLVRLLNEDHVLATLSRGYKRSSKGFRVATESDSADTLGDEPYQFFSKFPEIGVAVGEDRALAIPQILFELPDTKVILMDDAFQHRTVIPNLSILLTEFSRPFFSDYILPSGRLRESRSGAARADAIIVTKCPENLSEDQITTYKIKIANYAGVDVKIFFTTITYDDPVPVFKDQAKQFSNHVLLVSGIADVEPLRKYLSEKYHLVDSIIFPDHYKFQASDINSIRKKVSQQGSGEISVVTTEKDMVKLKTPKFREQFGGIPIYFIPIRVSFIIDGRAFDDMVKDVITV